MPAFNQDDARAFAKAAEEFLDPVRDSMHLIGRKARQHHNADRVLKQLEWVAGEDTAHPAANAHYFLDAAERVARITEATFTDVISGSEIGDRRMKSTWPVAARHLYVETQDARLGNFATMERGVTPLARAARASSQALASQGRSAKYMPPVFDPRLSRSEFKTAIQSATSEHRAAERRLGSAERLVRTSRTLTMPGHLSDHVDTGISLQQRYLEVVAERDIRLVEDTFGVDSPHAAVAHGVMARTTTPNLGHSELHFA